MQALHDKRQARMKKRRRRQRPHGSLNAEQKAVFDAHTLRGMGMQRGGHRGMPNKPAGQG
jgi:hypothetical protein